MNDLPRQTLSGVIARHGAEICDTPKRVEAMLRDLCGAHRREINVIMGALEERVAADLTAAGNSLSRDVLFARLEARLRDNLAYTPEAARWGVETWAVALGILSEAELQERRGKESSASQSNAPIPMPTPRPSGANPPGVSPPAPHSTNRPPQQPPEPPNVRQPAPAPRRMPQPSPNIVVTQPPPDDLSPSPPLRQTLRRGLTLRSCLTIFFLVIVLIITALFVVPAVIMILQEEQERPSINEPRIK